MRRLIYGLIATMAVLVVATIAFLVVSHIDSSSWLIYFFGILSIIPLPVALVFIFLMMNRGLRDE